MSAGHRQEAAPEPGVIKFSVHCTLRLRQATREKNPALEATDLPHLSHLASPEAA